MLYWWRTFPASPHRNQTILVFSQKMHFCVIPTRGEGGRLLVTISTEDNLRVWVRPQQCDGRKAGRQWRLGDVLIRQCWECWVTDRADWDSQVVVLGWDWSVGYDCQCNCFLLEGQGSVILPVNYFLSQTSYRILRQLVRTGLWNANKAGKPLDVLFNPFQIFNKDLG